MARVELEHVDKTFPDGTRAAADVTLQVADSELLVLVGPSGCGKSTVLRLVAGLETATAGTIRIGDRVVNDVRPQERNVAMVFQDYALYPHMTTRRNLEFPLRMRRQRRSEIDRSVARVAGLLEIGHLLDRLPRQLSGGQRQRVAMGRALVREPAASLLDEPLSNLDPRLRVQVRAEIQDLQARTRTTMLYVTHDQVEAMTLGHRVAVMDSGRLQQVATPRELYAAPANIMVAGFIGNPPMNLLPARVGDGPALLIGRGTVPLPDAPADVADGWTVGLRPEALDVVPATDARAAVPARIAHLESLGYETLAHLRLEGDDDARLVARLVGMPALAPGQPVGLVVDPAQVRLFDRDGRLVR
jgi:multiple sugar transport system ATP-binding protein